MHTDHLSVWRNRNTRPIEIIDEFRDWSTIDRNSPCSAASTVRVGTREGYPFAIGRTRDSRVARLHRARFCDLERVATVSGVYTPKVRCCSGSRYIDQIAAISTSDGQ